MADFTISGKMKVKTLKANFKSEFGSTLRVYNGQKFADDEATLASIRRSDAKGGDVKINGKMLVGNFEKKILEEFGIKVQVATPDDSKLSEDSITLTASGK
ncbi:hypothetical protein [Capnocytophaga canimorsus]|uniref:Uncharacterized protein n=1 Tax=Capnocytophaga canimorsus (strain 5) TaxID=860228 RepID=F9YW15_CAPCC|nr:hypothetical protein [Capnocytophaga canimorsus]AEK24518.1 Conserved hypothetical protein [Capnocytophaga canimorsus Cc5]ATA77368.1 hypothetical protein CGC47_07120 [Capnocytophaga canimorsus]AWL78835.1 hypothetical protein DKB58_07715 [Capnocytophaga canimorsus]AYW37440.1 hypothetical protein D8L92_09150 [Capnocytophaga canimorsus]MDT9500225.1 hypothetical protein [Capnocytophaga canimorsus]